MRSSGIGPKNPAFLVRPRVRRAGVTSLDYVLLLAVVFPLAAFILWAGPRIIRLACEMVCVLVSWPFM